MMLYLTGAQNSLRKSENNPQTDPSLSLGGYVSSTPAPNSALNAMFDVISSYTKENCVNETIALGLINTTGESVSNVRLKFICHPEDDAFFRVAAVPLSEDYSMERITNRYQEPIIGEFFDATFYRASVDVKVLNPATLGEEIYLTPFDVEVYVEEGGIEGTWKAFENAFENDEDFKVIRVSRDVFRIEAKFDDIVNSECSFYATDGFNCEFSGNFMNLKDNEVELTSTMSKGDGIGLWIQRVIKKKKNKSNEELIKDYMNGVIEENKEVIELSLTYDDSIVTEK